jgi:hypothetical protein
VIIVITVVILVVIIIVIVVGVVDFMPATSKTFAVVDWQLPHLFVVSDCIGSCGMTGGHKQMAQFHFCMILHSCTYCFGGGPTMTRNKQWAITHLSR